jgi:outer membrane receptor protein involved in Fe transport
MKVRLLAAAMAGASCCGLATPSAAMQAPMEFQIGAGSLRDALTNYARLSHRQLLYPSALVAGRSAPAVRGAYTADEALVRLLAGSGIGFRRAGRAFVLTAVAPQSAPPHRDSPPPRRRAAPPPRPRPAPAALPPQSEDEATIVITGSNIRGLTEGPSPVQVIGRQDIERAGHGSVAEAIAALPQNFGGTGTEDTVLTSSDRTILNNGLGSSANLRGLGSDATLTLLNGRRLAGSGGKGDFTDLSLIPLAAVERIEVLTDGASAIYGSDAVGGVVNIILRDNFSGGETRFRLGSVTQGATQEVQLGQVLGARWRTGSILTAYEYSQRDNLQATDRDFARSADLRPFGGSDFRSFYSNPGTIIGAGPTGALVPLFAIPPGQNGTALTPASFLPGASLSSSIVGTDLLPSQTRHSGYAIVRQDLVPGIQIFAEGRYGHRAYEYAGPASTTVIQVTAANPFFVSPNGQPFSLIAYSFIDELGAVRDRGTVEAWSGTTGLTADLGGDWSLDAYAGYAEEHTRVFIDNLVNASYVNEAAGATPDDPGTSFSTARDGFFNPYGDGLVNNAAVLDFIDQGYVREYIDSGLLSANFKVDGSLFQLPGGPVRAAFGAAFRRESFFRTGNSFLFGTSPTAGAVADSDRNVVAFFGEIVAPIVGPANARGGLQRLELSAAVRHERYSDFGSSTNPRFGIIWEPAAGFRLRASFGTSFRAPALREINDPLNVGATQLRDASNTLNAVIYLSGGNPDLEPEHARSFTVGAQIAPPIMSGFRADVTFFQTRFSNRIGQPAFEEISTVLRDNALSPFVTPISPATNPADRARVVALSNTPGSTVPTFVPPELFHFIIDARYVNTAQVLVRGLDILISQSFALFGGQGSLLANASYLFDYQRQSTPAAPRVEHVDTVGNPPDLRARLTASWDHGPWGASATVNYIDGYVDNVSVPLRHVDSWTTIDAQIRYRPDWRGFMHGFSFALSAQNIFDSDPPFVNRTTGQAYDATNADPLGRFISFQIIKNW